MAAGVTETELFAHIKSMMYTTIPAFVVSLILYAILGMRFDVSSVDTTVVDTILTGLSQNFKITPGYALISLIPLVSIVILAAKRVNALAIMVVASIIAMILAIINQGYNLVEMMAFMNYGFSASTGIADVDALLSRGGIQSMMWTVSLGYLGLSYGGILEKTGVMAAILNRLSVLTKNARNLILGHIFSTILVNLISTSQYVSIIIPGRMFYHLDMKAWHKNRCSL